eukprot:Opistho-2@69524
MATSVILRVVIPAHNVQKLLMFDTSLPVWFAKQLVLDKMAKDIDNAINHGLYLPPANGKAGKFLDEERPLSSYNLEKDAVVEFVLKRKELVRSGSVVQRQKSRDTESKAVRRKLLERIEKKASDKIAKMLQQGVDPNFQDEDNGELPLSYAVAYGAIDVIKALVAGGAYMDFRSKEGFTALHRAAQRGASDSLATLLDLGASPNYRDKSGLTPLYYAAIHGQHKCSELLLKDYSLVNVTDSSGWTELHHAAKHGHSYVVEQLIYYGCETDAQNATGNTPLHVTAVANQVSCARMLMKRGCNPNVTNKAGQTAVQVAIVSGNMELAQTIKAFKAEEVVRYKGEPPYNQRKTRVDPAALKTGGSGTRARLSFSGQKPASLASAGKPTAEVFQGPAPPVGWAVAIYPYMANFADELNLEENDVICITSKGDDGWWEGLLASGMQGVFPANYCEPTAPPPNASAFRIPGGGAGVGSAAVLVHLHQQHASPQPALSYSPATATPAYFPPAPVAVAYAPPVDFEDLPPPPPEMESFYPPETSLNSSFSASSGSYGMSGLSLSQSGSSLSRSSSTSGPPKPAKPPMFAGPPKPPLPPQ